MSDKTTNTAAPADTPQSAVGITPGMIEHLRIDGDAVERLAVLGAKAAGAETDWLYGTDELGDGLPLSIPLSLIKGEHPKIESLKRLVEEWRLHPERRKGTATVGDVASFCGLVNRQKIDSSVVFANSDWRAPSLTAVIDYHDAAADGPAGWLQHRVHYAFPFSDEWTVWAKNDGAFMTQEDFAEFVEDRAPDMTTLTEAESASFARDLQVQRIGTPSEIFELARGLQVNVSSKIRNDVKLQSGEAKITFEEEHSGADGQPVKVPGAFALMIPLFYGQEPITVPVRLRYRMRGGAILWAYKLFRVDRTITEAVDHAKAEVRRETGLAVYEGKPEAAGA